MELKFKKGILGFEDYNDFVVKDIEDNEVFKIIESKSDANVSLVIVSPFDIVEDYTVKIPEATIESLDIKSQEDVIIYTTVTLNSDIKKTTANLRAPIVINSKNYLAEQIILGDDKYKIKHPISKG